MRFAQIAPAALAVLVVPFLASCRGGLSSAHISAGESETIAQLRTLNRAEAAYSARHSHFACTLPELGSQFGLIDRELSYGEKGGYYFNIECATHSGVSSYQVWATPINTSITSSHFFCIDEAGAVRSASHRMDDCGDAAPVE